MEAREHASCGFREGRPGERAETFSSLTFSFPPSEELHAAPRQQRGEGKADKSPRDDLPWVSTHEQGNMSVVWHRHVPLLVHQELRKVILKRPVRLCRHLTVVGVRRSRSLALVLPHEMRTDGGEVGLEVIAQHTKPYDDPWRFASDGIHGS